MAPVASAARWVGAAVEVDAAVDVDEVAAVYWFGPYWSSGTSTGNW